MLIGPYNPSQDSHSTVTAQSVTQHSHSTVSHTAQSVTQHADRPLHFVVVPGPDSRLQAAINPSSDSSVGASKGTGLGAGLSGEIAMLEVEIASRRPHVAAIHRELDQRRGASLAGSGGSR